MRLHVVDTYRGISQKEHPVGRIDASRNRPCHTGSRRNDNIFRRVGPDRYRINDAPLSALGALQKSELSRLSTSFGMVASAIIQAD
jgi:hypothetical protein